MNQNCPSKVSKQAVKSIGIAKVHWVNVRPQGEK